MFSQVTLVCQLPVVQEALVDPVPLQAPLVQLDQEHPDKHHMNMMISQNAFRLTINKIQLNVISQENLSPSAATEDQLALPFVL